MTPLSGTTVPSPTVSGEPVPGKPVPCVLGVDVGTLSARAGVFDLDGNLRGIAGAPIQLHRPDPDRGEYSFDEIWSAVSAAVRAACAEAACGGDEGGVAGSISILGLAFDATCSLVALDENDQPLPVSPPRAGTLPGGPTDRNVIAWLDHRAVDEAERINQTGHPVLRYVGNHISPEMEPPKLLWLKEHNPQTWASARRFFDLADALAYRATAIDLRSTCTTICKWTYLGHESQGMGWDRSFFDSIGIGDLLDRGLAGERVAAMGTRIGTLTADSAKDLGLPQSTAVGVGVIDAHAGGIGLLGGADLATSLALIGGTSSCHMALSREPRFVDGIWGPYFGAMVPEWWLSEGGQSATGALIDHVIDDSAAGAALRVQAKAEGKTVYEVLNEIVARLETEHTSVEHASVEFVREITTDLHVLPDFHGNRSPRADPTLRGAIVGLSLDSSEETLARRYLATIQAVAYGTRQIVETLNSAGCSIAEIRACGGGTKNPIWLREHADSLGIPIVLAREPEAVLLGAAMLAAVAAGRYPGVEAAMAAMGGIERTIHPDPSRRNFHDRKYEVFLRLHDDHMAYRSIMK